MKKEIIPAIIAKTQEEMEDKINKVKDFVNIIQLDVMDGLFVPTHSLDFDIKLPKIKGRYEAHLMVSNPEEWIKRNYKKVDIIIAHFESVKYPEKVISLAKNKKKKIGFSINPKTPVQSIKPYLDKLDLVLVMTVDPGFYGSKFIPEMAEKIKELRNLKPSLDIEVDGGINPETIKIINDAGANLFVSGSYLLKNGNTEKAIEVLKELVGSP